MLWTSLRWNWGNTVVVAGFCALALLGAVNNAFVSGDHDGARPDQALACVGLCEKDTQPTMGAPRVDVAPAMTALLGAEAIATD